MGSKGFTSTVGATTGYSVGDGVTVEVGGMTGATVGGGTTGATVGTGVTRASVGAGVIIGRLVRDSVATGTNAIVGVAVGAGGVGASVTRTGVDDGLCVGTEVPLGTLGGFLSVGLFVGAEVVGIGGTVDCRSVGLTTGN